MVQIIAGRARFVIGMGYDVDARAELYRGFVLGELPSGKWEVEDMLGCNVGVCESHAAARALVDAIRSE